MKEKEKGKSGKRRKKVVEGEETDRKIDRK
jgi:hypothetical protein